MANQSCRKYHHPILCYGNGFHNPYKGYQLNLGSGKNGYSDSYREIVDKIIATDEWVDYFGRTFILRFDLMLDNLGVTNGCSASKSERAQAVISVFCDRVSRYLTTKVNNPRDKRTAPLRNHKYAPINWVREYSKKKGFHYHCYIILDGKKLDCIGSSSHQIISLRSLLEHYWIKAVNDMLVANPGLISKPYVHINQGNKRASYLIPAKGKLRGYLIKELIEHLSYLGKVRSKTYHSKTGGRLHTHRIKRAPVLKAVPK